MYQRAAPTIAHLKEVVEYTKRLKVSAKLYVNPLNSLKESFYTGGILFSCLHDKRKDIFAAGGRYDHLIKEQRRMSTSNHDERHAVGFSLAWERLAKIPKGASKSFLKRPEEELNTMFSGRRVSLPPRCFATVFILTLCSAMYWWPASTWPYCGLRGSNSFRRSGNMKSAQKSPKMRDLQRT